MLTSTCESHDVTVFPLIVYNLVLSCMVKLDWILSCMVKLDWILFTKKKKNYIGYFPPILGVIKRIESGLPYF